VYFAGWGDGKSFLTQYNEVVTIQEVWDRFDAVGVVGKPRVLVVMKTRALYFIRRALNFMKGAIHLRFDVVGIVCKPHLLVVMDTRHFSKRALNFKRGAIHLRFDDVGFVGKPRLLVVMNIL